MGLLRILKRILDNRDRYSSLSLRHGGLFQRRGLTDKATAAEHASFDPIDRSPTSRLREAGFTANTPDEVRNHRREAIERERRRRLKVHRRKSH